MGSRPQPSALLKRVKTLPDQPGVYLFKDHAGGILYVGKALSLRRRVSSYFRPPHRFGGRPPTPCGGRTPSRLSPRIARLVERVADVEVQTTASEAEALLRESDLIKQYHPKYNVAYRDDKSYPLLKLTNERFPRLLLIRSRRANRPDQQSGRYFGPYPDAGAVHEALRFLRRVFPMRTCRQFPKTPCLEYHIGQCLAPCVGWIDESSYQRIVNDLVEFLEGKRDELLRDLAKRMEHAASRQRFEEAARLRDQIQALTSVIVAKEKSSLAGPLEQLQLALKLSAPPKRIEAFDCSNLYGTFAVGSMVTFVDGKPRKAHYRHFKIKTVSGIDDYQMMRELIRRRYSGSLSTTLPWPDLIIVDGGRGQLNAALDELKALDRAISTMGLAKRFEHVMVPDQPDPIVLLPTSPVLHLIQRIRDEAHRFAITYHRRLRAKGLFKPRR